MPPPFLGDFQETLLPSKHFQSRKTHARQAAVHIVVQDMRDLEGVAALPGKLPQEFAEVGACSFACLGSVTVTVTVTV